MLETNELLKTQQAYAEEIRPTIIRTVELIQTLTDTTLATQAAANANTAQAERHARASMIVAISSVVIAVVTGAISIYYANASPTAAQVDLLGNGFKEQLRASNNAAQAERCSYEKMAAEDRAMMAVFLVQMRAGSTIYTG